MAPAFSSARQATAFGALLLVLLLLPLIFRKSWLPPREQIYSSIWWANGAFPYLDQEIFKEKGDIDLAFIGASHIWHAIDTPYVQEKLSEKLGRPAVVRSLCWGGPSYDALYFITQDLLQHRKVRTLVYYDVYDEEDIRPMPHVLAPHWFRFRDNAEALAGLPFKLQASYYFASILGIPRNLLSLVSPNRPANLYILSPHSWLVKEHAVNPALRLGALTEELRYSPGAPLGHAPFVEYSPQTNVQPSAACIYSPETSAKFRFTRAGVPAPQLHFAQKFAALAQEHGCQLILLHVPVFTERRSDVITENLFWPETLKTDIAMVGIPPADLFSGLSDEDIEKLYCNQGHLNKNGQKYFTTLITPTLLQTYDASKN